MKFFAKVLLFFFLIGQFLSFQVQQAHAFTAFSAAYVTMQNSRFSFLGRINTSVPIGTKDFVIKTSAQPDNNTGNLYNGDTVCFNNDQSNGCVDQTAYTVSDVVDPTAGTVFSTSAGVGSSVLNGDRVVASQSGKMTLTFTPTTTYTVTNLRVYLPAGTNSVDGIPDSAAFDTNRIDNDALTVANILQASGGSIAISPSFTYSKVNIAGQSYTSLLVPVTGLDTSTAFTLTLGHASSVSDRFINPAPSGTAHARGTADKLVITLQTEDASANIIDKADMGVSPNDGVFVTAYVPTSVTWTIAGTTAATTHCSVVTKATTTATSVPFGTIYASDTFFDAAQTHTITTNATNGYILAVSSDGVLTNVGTGQTIASGNCNGSCTTTSNAAWSTATNNGFGYTLANVSGTDAAFTSNYKLFDTITTTAPTYGYQTIATNASVVSGSSIDLCYRLSVGGTQRAGLYYNKITYQAYPKF